MSDECTFLAKLDYEGKEVTTPLSGHPELMRLLSEIVERRSWATIVIALPAGRVVSIQPSQHLPLDAFIKRARP